MLQKSENVQVTRFTIIILISNVDYCVRINVLPVRFSVVIFGHRFLIVTASIPKLFNSCLFIDLPETHYTTQTSKFPSFTPNYNTQPISRFSSRTQHRPPDCDADKWHPINFRKRHKAGDVLVDLTAHYDIVWHQGLVLKLLRRVPDRHLVRSLCTNFLHNSFILKTSEGHASRPRRLRNRVPEGSVPAPPHALQPIHQRPAPHNIKAVNMRMTSPSRTETGRQ